MRVESHDDRLAVKFLRPLFDFIEKGLVAAVHAVEISDGDSGVDEGSADIFHPMKDFH
jgi:hypothetical protein